MQIILANPRGFCAGVHMAIDAVQELIDLIGTPLYVYHAIVHNKHVVARFVAQGVTFVESIDDVPAGATVVFSAHGVSPAVRDASKNRDLRMIDATCPLVTKVHVEARRYAKMGHQILLIGHADHQEIKGTYGEAPQVMHIVETPACVAKLNFQKNQPLTYLTQTTLSVDDANVIIAAIKKRFPWCNAPPKEDICYATTNRQHAVRQLAPCADLTLVIGSKNSSNSVRLKEMSEHDGTPAYLLDDKSELRDDWFKGIDTVLVTAGASAPDDLVQDVLNELTQRYNGHVDESELIKENVKFALPVQLRILKYEMNKKDQD
ncbi:MAG: 4-hydroxy-3-methylbut-2-enyl diphosphate reductase [Algisphaera sp.]